MIMEGNYSIGISDIIGTIMDDSRKNMEVIS